MYGRSRRDNDHPEGEHCTSHDTTPDTRCEPVTCHPKFSYSSRRFPSSDDSGVTMRARSCLEFAPITDGVGVVIVALAVQRSDQPTSRRARAPAHARHRWGSELDVQLARDISGRLARLTWTPTLPPCRRCSDDGCPRRRRSASVLERVLGYEEMGDDDLLDPRGRGPSIWFQPIDEQRSGGSGTRHNAICRLQNEVGATGQRSGISA